jgi:hypothetical protein
MTEIADDREAAAVPAPHSEMVPEGYPDERYPARRRLGQFDFSQAAGLSLCPEDLAASCTPFGLRFTDAGLIPSLTGESGQRYRGMHTVRGDADGSLSALVSGHRSSPSGAEHDPRYGSEWSDLTKVTQASTPEGRLVYTLSGSSNSEQISIGPDDVTWTSRNGDIELSGTVAGQGSQWRNAWRSPGGHTSEMLFTHHGFEVSGSYFGEQVTGHFLLETYFGNENYVDTWWVQNRVGGKVCFINNYADASSEHGDFLCGEYGARMAIVTDNSAREALCTTNINMFDEPDGGIRCELGTGDVWKVTPDPGSEMSFPQFRTRFGFGSIQRVGETRRLAASSCNFIMQGRLPAPQPTR